MVVALMPHNGTALCTWNSKKRTWRDVRIKSEMRFEHAINRPSEFARSRPALFECARFVGSVERSDTHEFVPRQ